MGLDRAPRRRVGRRHRRVALGAALALATSLLAYGPLALATSATPATHQATRLATPADSGLSGTIPTLPRSSGYVSRLFGDLLGQPASEAEVAYWGGLIDRDGSVVPAIDSITRTNGWLGRQVSAAYTAWLGRSPDAAGLSYWVGRLQAGATYEQFAASVLGGSEFAAKWAGSGTSPQDSLVHGLYETLLGRAPDAAGAAYWDGVLAAPTAAPVAVSAMEASSEAVDRSVAAVYQLVFDRAVDPVGASYWRGRFQRGSSNRDGLVRALLESSERVNGGCDPLAGTQCLLPYPDDYLTVPDASTITGERLALSSSMLPTNVHGTPVDPSPTNRSDGFSTGAAVTLLVPGLDLAETGAVPITDIAQYADADAPIAVIDAATGVRQPIWTEMDSTAPVGHQVLYIRPARNWTAGHRYIVAMRNLENSSGQPLAAPSVFAAYRDHGSSPVDGFSNRIPHMEQLFTTLGNAGFDRSSLYLAWDFTIASTANTTGRLLHIRDDAFSRLGSGAPAFQVTSVQADPRSGIASEVKGTYQVPSYLTQDAPGGRFLEGPDGLPEYAGHDLTTTFTCMIPTTALTTPARGVVYGHGLFGDQSEVEGQIMPALHNMVYCATDWLGMASSDVGTAFQILQNVSLFPELADRVQEGVIAQLFLGELLKNPAGFASNAAFQNSSHQPVVATGDVFYDGNSQGGILGGLTTAVSNVWTRAVLGVTGMDFSLLVQRSTDFGPFNSVLSSSYPDPVDRAVGLEVLQGQWDRAEPDGYAAYLTSDPLPNTPAHDILMDIAVGDHQVATIAADNEARTAGVSAHIPAVAEGRSTDVTPLWGIPAITSYPFDGSAIFYWDSGSPLPPTTNTPPTSGHDPHEDPRNAITTAQQKSDFLQTDGSVTDPCNGQPCVIPQA